MIAGPASAAAMDCSAISSGVSGSADDMVGVCADPVIAQVMITFFAMSCSVKLLCARGPSGPGAIIDRTVARSAKLKVSDCVAVKLDVADGWPRLPEGRGFERRKGRLLIDRPHNF